MNAWNLNKLLHRGSLNALAFGLAALLMVGTLTEALHYVVVPHAYCAEHGELEHRDGHVEAMHSHGHGLELDGAEKASHAHAACGLAVLGRKRGTTAHTASASLVGYPALAAMAEPPVTSFTISIVPLDFAPKNSPPRA